MAHRGAGLVWRTSRRWATPGRPAQRATRGMLVGRVVAVPPSCGMADGTAGCVPPCSGARAVSTYRQAHDGGASAGAGRDAGANPQAAGLVIGDEILTGKTSDKNVPFLAKFMFERGIDLRCVEMVRDDMPTLVERLHYLSELVGPDGYVVTTGGIGPTHDDITYDAVAAAFGVGLELHKPTHEALKRISRERGQELTPARLRMAMLPAGCGVHVAEDLWVPLVVIGNVHVLPGIPWLYRKMMQAHQGLFKGGRAYTRRVVFTHMPEGDLAASLGAIADRYAGVAIGSYPQTNRGATSLWKCKLTFEGADAAAVEAASLDAQRMCEGFVDAGHAAAEPSDDDEGNGKKERVGMS